MRSEEEHKH